jgi:hypothetical protein
MKRHFQFTINNKTEFKQAHTAKDLLKTYGIVLSGTEKAQANKTYQNNGVMVSYKPISEKEYKLGTFVLPETARGQGGKARRLRARLRTELLRLEIG